MNADEIDENSISRDPNIKSPIKIESATFKWTKDDAPVLKNITMEINKKKLVAIVGQVGSGKFIYSPQHILKYLLRKIISFVCNAGDLVKTKGNVNVNVR